MNYLNCGKLYSQGSCIFFKVFKFDDLISKIIPLFAKYSINGVKQVDFLDFCAVAEVMQNKDNLTSEDLDKITDEQS